MKDSFEKPVRVDLLIAMLQSVSKSEGCDNARVTVSDDKRFLIINDGRVRQASVCLVADVSVHVLDEVG
jgi:hypothetical protein